MDTVLDADAEAAAASRTARSDAEAVVTPAALQHAPVLRRRDARRRGAPACLLAWWLRRHTSVSIRNVYLAAAIAIALDAAALYQARRESRSRALRRR